MTVNHRKQQTEVRDAVKNYLADFFPPIPLSFFGNNDFPLRGGGVPPNSIKEKIR